MKNSLRAILRIMFSYYKPMKYIDIICTTTCIIYTFNTHGQTFKPTSSSFKLLKTMNIICNMEFIIESAIYKSIETCPIISNNTTNCPKAHCKYLWKKPKLFTNKSPWGIKTHGKHVLDYFVGCTQPGPKGPAHVSKPKPKKHQQEAKDWEWATSPCSFLTKKSN